MVILKHLGVSGIEAGNSSGVMIFLPDEFLSLWKEVKMKEVGVALLCLFADPACPHL